MRNRAVICHAATRRVFPIPSAEDPPSAGGVGPQHAARRLANVSFVVPASNSHYRSESVGNASATCRPAGRHAEWRPGLGPLVVGSRQASAAWSNSSTHGRRVTSCGGYCAWDGRPARSKSYPRRRRQIREPLQMMKSNEKTCSTGLRAHSPTNRPRCCRRPFSIVISPSQIGQRAV